LPGNAPVLVNDVAEVRADFAARHIGPSEEDQRAMLAVLGYASLDDLMAAALPATARPPASLARLPSPRTEQEVLADLRRLAGRNQLAVPMIGLGYYGTVTPAVIRRNVLENPAWYTAYTPYQPEISQGRLEALLNFQTMVCDLTGLDLANASLLDEASAAAEAMTLARRAAGPRAGSAFLADADCLPQTIDVLRTRAEPLGVELRVAPVTADTDFTGTFGVLLQYPGASGEVRDLAPVIEAAHAAGARVAVAADLLALTLLKPPGELGADMALGSTQRFGVPLFYGGPHAAYFAVRDDLRRQLPGRLVGVSVDADGRPAYRLALQAREQHIRREKATSNICTAQVLLAVAAAMYACYHGPDGLAAIARRVHSRALTLAATLRDYGLQTGGGPVVDTVAVRLAGPAQARAAVSRAREAGYQLYDAGDGVVQVSCDETTQPAHLRDVVAALAGGALPGGGTLADRAPSGGIAAAEVRLSPAGDETYPASLARTSKFLTHPVFSAHRSETAMLRYLRRLSDMDVALDRSMIPLGSCTMKLNATAEMEAVTWPEFAGLHPLAPAADAAGYTELIGDLERWLCAVTGYDACSLQPNAGSAGELAGLLAIRAYHRSRGDEGRDVCLIPASAHGTNAASAVLAGLRVAVVRCGADGAIDLDDLRAVLAEHGDRVAAIMVTYPSTNGVYEETVTAVADLVHAAGGQVYIDGANLNALAGVASPALLGGDVSLLTLHKGRAGRGPGAPGSVPAAAGRPGGGRPGGRAGGQRPVRFGRHPAHLVGLHRPDGRGRAAPGHAGGGPVRQLHRPPARAALPGPVRGAGGPGGPRVHRRPAPPAGRDHRRGRGQAPHRLRLPRADHVLPRRGHVHDRTDRERVPGGDRRVLRRADRRAGRGGQGGVRCLGRGGQPAEERAAHRRDAHPPGLVPSLPAGRGRLPGRLRPAGPGRRPGQVLAAGPPHRPGLRRPQPGLRLPPAGGVRRPGGDTGAGGAGVRRWSGPGPRRYTGRDPGPLTAKPA
jgi:glycine dehydrogenase